MERPAHDYYEILQVHPKATLPVIKKAYRTLMLEQGHHPDQGGDSKEASLLTEAYRVLSHAEKRAEYDRAYFAAARPNGAEPEAPSASAGESATSLIVRCPGCKTKNRVRSKELLGQARCSRCQQSLARLPNPVVAFFGALGAGLRRLPRPSGLKLGLSLLLLVLSGVALTFALSDGYATLADPIEATDQLRARGQLDQAAVVLQRALDREPGNPRLHEKLGDVFVKQRLYEEALGEYRRAIELNPTNSYLHALAGATLLQLNRLGEAELSYKQALKLDPQQAVALIALGNVYAKRQRFGDAEKLYQQALRQQPNADVFYNLGMVYQWNGRPKEATASFMQALIADPNHRASMVSLAALYYEQKHYDKAAAQLIKASQLQHTDLDLHLKLADIYERTGRKPEAIREWEVCLNQAKDDPGILARARRALRRLGVES